MALIKCPECGKEVSTAAKTCPHCGYPLKEQTATNYPDPIDNWWVGIWKDRVWKTKLKWTLIFFGSLIISMVFFILLRTDREITTYGSYPKIIWLILTYVAGMVTFVMFAFWIAALICVKARAKQYDGYTVLVFMSFNPI